MTQGNRNYGIGVCNALELRCNALQCYSVRVSRDHLALYGNVTIPRAYCKDCGGFAFVIDGRLKCCNQVYEFSPKRYRRMSEPEYSRKLPSLSSRRAVLREQQNYCFYCSQEFGKEVRVKGRLRVLRPVWDHLIPYSWQAKNSGHNFVAACQFCNAWKGAIMFDTVEGAQVYVFNKWKEAKTETKEEVRVLRYGVPT